MAEKENNMIEASKDIIQKIQEEGIIGGRVGGSYGHAVNGFIYELDLGSRVYSPEKQKEQLRESALGIIQEFGPKIIPILRGELRAVLTDEEIALYEG